MSKAREQGEAMAKSRRSVGGGFGRASRWGVVALGVAAALGVAGCDDAREQARRAPPPAPAPFEPQPLEALAARLTTLEPNDTMRQALWALNEALDHPEALPVEARDRYRWLLARVALDLWMDLLLAQSAPSADDDPATRERKRDLEGLLSAALPSGTQRPGEPRTAPMIRRMRELIQPVRQRAPDPATRADADAALRVIDLLEAQDDPALQMRAAARVRALREGVFSAYGHALLALRAMQALDDLPPLEGVTDWPLLLAVSQGQVCRDALARLPSILDPDEALLLLRRRCGMACSEIPPLGEVAVAAEPLSPDIASRCGPQHLDLPPFSRGLYLSFDNFLALRALSELSQIHDTLQLALKNAPDYAAKLAPLIERFHARIAALVIPGQPPLLGPLLWLSPTQTMKLPLLHQARRALQPTPTLLTFDGQRLYVAAWPRFQLQHGQPVALADARYGFPGALLAAAPPSADTWDADTVLALQDALAAIQKHPLAAPLAPAVSPANPKAATSAAAPAPLPTITLLIDADADARSLRAIGLLLRRAGISRLQLAAWPVTADSRYIHRPVLSAVELRVDRPDPFTARLRLADHDTALFNPLGRRVTQVPILDVRTYLPDIYATTAAYAARNPGLDGLIIDPAPALSIQTLTHALDALRAQRQGDILASTAKLLRADPIEDERGTTAPVMWPLFLNLNPVTPPPSP
jgi:hypothetical protein